jgi:hypothetical protein
MTTRQKGAWKAPAHLHHAFMKVGLTVQRVEEVFNCDQADCNFMVNMPKAAMCCADQARAQAVIDLDRQKLLAPDAYKPYKAVR